MTQSKKTAVHEVANLLEVCQENGVSVPTISLYTGVDVFTVRVWLKTWHMTGKLASKLDSDERGMFCLYRFRETGEVGKISDECL